MLDTGQLPLAGSALVWFREGLTFAAEGAYSQAVASYNRVLQTRPDCDEVWYERGLALEQLGCYQDAIASYDRALALQPRSSEVTFEIWLNRADALQYGLGDYEAAIASYDRALTLDPDSYLCWHHRGNALMYGLDQYEAAIASYNRALAICSDHYLSWQNRGNALAELGQYPAAIASYERALAIQPDDQALWHGLDRIVDRSGTQHKLPTTNPVSQGYGYHGRDRTEEREELDTVIVDPPTSTASTRACQGPVLIIEDEQGRRNLRLDKALYSVGRDPQSEICLHSQYASRHHATLIRLSQGDGSCAYRIVDGNLKGKRSTNGLMINGRKQADWELNHNDEVVFGPQVRIIYHSPEQDLEEFSVI